MSLGSTAFTARLRRPALQAGDRQPARDRHRQRRRVRQRSLRGNAISSPACISSAVSVGATDQGRRGVDLLERRAVPLAVRAGRRDPIVGTRRRLQRLERHVDGGAARGGRVGDHPAGGSRARASATVLSALRTTGLPITDTRWSGAGTTRAAYQHFRSARRRSFRSRNPVPVLTSFSPARLRAGTVAGDAHAERIELQRLLGRAVERLAAADDDREHDAAARQRSRPRISSCRTVGAGGGPRPVTGRRHDGVADGSDRSATVARAESADSRARHARHGDARQWFRRLRRLDLVRRHERRQFELPDVHLRRHRRAIARGRSRRRDARHLRVPALPQQHQYARRDERAGVIDAAQTPAPAIASIAGQCAGRTGIHADGQRYRVRHHQRRPMERRDSSDDVRERDAAAGGDRRSRHRVGRPVHVTVSTPAPGGGVSNASRSRRRRRPF